MKRFKFEKKLNYYALYQRTWYVCSKNEKRILILLSFTGLGLLLWLSKDFNPFAWQETSGAYADEEEVFEAALEIKEREKENKPFYFD